MPFDIREALRSFDTEDHDMEVKLGKSTHPVSDAEIKAFEARVGAALPDAYKQFLSVHNGVRPETNIFRISEVNDSGINGFIPLSQILRERALIEHELPFHAIPIAWAEGGNYVCLDLDRAGTVFFWDHEEPEPITYLAETLEDFLNQLKRFDVSSIELKPGQVKSAWIDPSLLE